MPRRKTPQYCTKCQRLNWFKPASGTPYVYPVYVWTWHGSNQVQELRGYTVRIKSLEIHAYFSLSQHPNALEDAKHFVHTTLYRYAK